MNHIPNFYKRCCSFALILLLSLHSLAVQAANAYIPRFVAMKWLIGNQYVWLDETLKKSIEVRVAQYDYALIQKNIEVIKMYLEFGQDYIHNNGDLIPKEYVYLMLLDNKLVKASANNHASADNALWSLSDWRVHVLGAGSRFYEDKYTTDRNSLLSSTQAMIHELKSSNGSIRNWALNLLTLDYGYKEAQDKINTHYNQKISLYKDKTDFKLTMQAAILVEYFALRHVLEYAIKESTSQLQARIYRHPLKEGISLKKAAHKFKLSKETLLMYNGWIKNQKTNKDIEQNWFVPTENVHTYIPPSSPQKEIIREPTIPMPKIAPKNAVIKNQPPVVPEPKNISFDLPVFHIVSKGETLFSIARKYNISLDSLRALNPMFRPNLDNRLVIGTRLLVVPTSEHQRKTFHPKKKEEIYTNPRGDKRVKDENVISKPAPHLKPIQRLRNMRKVRLEGNRGIEKHYPRLSPTQKSPYKDYKYKLPDSKK